MPKTSKLKWRDSLCCVNLPVFEKVTVFDLHAAAALQVLLSNPEVIASVPDGSSYQEAELLAMRANQYAAFMICERRKYFD